MGVHSHFFKEKKYSVHIRFQFSLHQILIHFYIRPLTFLTTTTYPCCQWTSPHWQKTVNKSAYFKTFKKKRTVGSSPHPKIGKKLQGVLPKSIPLSEHAAWQAGKGGTNGQSPPLNHTKSHSLNMGGYLVTPWQSTLSSCQWGQEPLPHNLCLVFVGVRGMTYQTCPHIHRTMMS